MEDVFDRAVRDVDGLPAPMIKLVTAPMIELVTPSDDQHKPKKRRVEAEVQDAGLSAQLVATEQPKAEAAAAEALQEAAKAKQDAAKAKEDAANARKETSKAEDETTLLTERLERLKHQAVVAAKLAVGQMTYSPVSYQGVLKALLNNFKAVLCDANETEARKFKSAMEEYERKRTVYLRQLEKHRAQLQAAQAAQAAQAQSQPPSLMILQVNEQTKKEREVVYTTAQAATRGELDDGPNGDFYFHDDGNPNALRTGRLNGFVKMTVGEVQVQHTGSQQTLSGSTGLRTALGSQLSDQDPFTPAEFRSATYEVNTHKYRLRVVRRTPASSAKLPLAPTEPTKPDPADYARRVIDESYMKVPDWVFDMVSVLPQPTGTVEQVKRCMDTTCTDGDLNQLVAEIATEASRFSQGFEFTTESEALVLPFDLHCFMQRARSLREKIKKEGRDPAAVALRLCWHGTGRGVTASSFRQGVRGIEYMLMERAQLGCAFYAAPTDVVAASYAVSAGNTPGTGVVGLYLDTTDGRGTTPYQLKTGNVHYVHFGQRNRPDPTDFYRAAVYFSNPDGVVPVGFVYGALANKEAAPASLETAMLQLASTSSASSSASSSSSSSSSK